MPNSSINFVLCCDILEHLLAPEELLNEIYRILKGGGKAFISVPNLVSIGNRISFLIGSGSGIELAQLVKFKTPFIPISGPRFPDQRLHIRWFTSKSLSKFIKQKKFKIMEKFGIAPITSHLKIDKYMHSVSLLAGVIIEKL